MNDYLCLAIKVVKMGLILKKTSLCPPSHRKLISVNRRWRNLGLKGFFDNFEPDVLVVGIEHLEHPILEHNCVRRFKVVVDLLKEGRPG